MDTSFQSDAMTLYVMAASLLFEWTTCSNSELATSSISDEDDDDDDTVAYSLPSTSPTTTIQSPSSVEDSDSSPPSPPHANSKWQLSVALTILRRSASDRNVWARCYLSPWPILIFGHAVTEREDMQLIRQVLQEMRERIGYGEIQRILEELQLVWDARWSEADDLDFASKLGSVSVMPKGWGSLLEA